MSKIIPTKKLIKVLKKYEKGALDQMKDGGLKDTKSIFSQKSLDNFELVGAIAQFMTVRDIANELGLIDYFVNEE